MDFLNNLILGCIDDSIDGNNFPFQELNIRRIGVTHEIWLLLVSDVRDVSIRMTYFFIFTLIFVLDLEDEFFLGGIEYDVYDWDN